MPAPTYSETIDQGQCIVTATLLNHPLAEARVAGCTKAAMAKARRDCKARVKYLLAQARP